MATKIRLLRELRRRPLVCFTLAFVLGSALTSETSPPGKLLLPGGVLFLAVAALAFCKRPALAGWATLAGAACAGGLLFSTTLLIATRDVSRLQRRGAATLIGRIADQPSNEENRWRFTFAVESARRGRLAQPLTGEVYVQARSSRPLVKGDELELMGRLRPVRRAKNPGEISREAFLIPRGIRAVLEVGDERLIRRLRPGALASRGWAERTRERVLALLRASLPGPFQDLHASLLGSLIFGLRATPLPKEVSETFRRVGAIHVLVVSGTQVSLLFAAVYLPGVLCRAGSGRRRRNLRFLPGRLGLGLALAAVCFYALLAGGGQSVVRAAIMAGLVGLGLLLLRTEQVSLEHGLNVDRYTLLAAAALAILVFAPLSLFDIGFQLSFAAVWGLCYLAPVLLGLLSFLPRSLGLTAAGTIAAQLATAPLLIWHFHSFPVIGFLANLVIIPLAGVLLFLGLGTCLLSALSVKAAFWTLGWLSAKLTGTMLLCAHIFAAAPAASPSVYLASPLQVGGLYLGVIALTELLRAIPRRRQAIPSLTPTGF